MQPSFIFEKEFDNSFLVAGIDEAGRGPLAGPVVAACVILNQKLFEKKFARAVDDSKKLSKKQRGEVFFELQKSENSELIKFGVGIVSEKIIDEINILQATKLAMQKAFLEIFTKHKIWSDVVLVDGNFNPFAEKFAVNFFEKPIVDFEEQRKKIVVKTIIKGDEKSLSIAAASIIAKETRDEIMNKIHQKYPAFNFNKNAGYGTKFHLEKIRQIGICEFHRKSFEPIKSMFRESN